MAEENQVEPQQVTTEPQQVTKEPQQVTQVTKEPQVQRVTTKNPKKVEAGKRLAESNHKKSGSYRWYWLLHLSNQESRATK